jgi:hypothetical protein
LCARGAHLELPYTEFVTSELQNIALLDLMALAACIVDDQPQLLWSPGRPSLVHPKGTRTLHQSQQRIAVGRRLCFDVGDHQDLILHSHADG